ncbi:MAG: hypothetical protein ABI954_15185 [Pyrinomonadaceae bacterium]
MSALHQFCLHLASKSSYREKLVMETQQTSRFQFTKLLKRIGAAGILFFVVKGLVWLLVPLLVGYSLWE